MSARDFPSTPDVQVTHFRYQINSTAGNQSIEYVIPTIGEADGISEEDRLIAFELYVAGVADEVSASSVTKQYLGTASVSEPFTF
jgi:hypothetical protein